MVRFTLGMVALSCAALVTVANAGADAYPAKITQWRQEFDADVRSGGWLTLIDRVKVDEGSWTVGSDPGSAVRLPAKAPARLGVLVRHARVFQFAPALGFTPTIDDKPVSGITDLSTKSGTGRIRGGDISLSVRSVGDDFYLLVADSKNPAIATFEGNTWFPIDPAYRITATFEPYAQSVTERLPLTHVDSKQEFASTGDVTFVLDGKPVRLQTFIDDGELFVMFADTTNGKETYGGGRFLHAPIPKDGTTVLDFNKAFNPYCSVNSFVMCPITPAGNRLDTRVAAGERFHGEH